MATAAPTLLLLQRGGRQLVVDFAADGQFTLPAEFLRVHSPSAEVQGHGPGQRRLISGRREVAIAAVEPVGNYAVRLVFDDGHDTGLYTWDHLLRFGRERETLWSDYLAALEAAGQTREP